MGRGEPGAAREVEAEARQKPKGDREGGCVTPPLGHQCRRHFMRPASLPPRPPSSQTPLSLPITAPAPSAPSRSSTLLSAHHPHDFDILSAPLRMHACMCTHTHRILFSSHEDPYLLPLWTLLSNTESLAHSRSSMLKEGIGLVNDGVAPWFGPT